MPAEKSYVILNLVANESPGLYVAKTVSKPITLGKGDDADDNKVRTKLTIRLHDA